MLCLWGFLFSRRCRSIIEGSFCSRFGLFTSFTICFSNIVIDMYLDIHRRRRFQIFPTKLRIDSTTSLPFLINFPILEQNLQLLHQLFILFLSDPGPRSCHGWLAFIINFPISLPVTDIKGRSLMDCWSEMISFLHTFIIEFFTRSLIFIVD